MGTIYAKADQVIVWVGPAANGSDSLMKAWQSVGQAARDWGMESYYARERLTLLSRIINNVEPSDPKTAAFHTLLQTAGKTFAPLLANSVLKDWFERPYFGRAWITQEFCLCPKTLFTCGTKTVPVELVMLAIQILQLSIGQYFEQIYKPANVPLDLINNFALEPTARLFGCRERRRRFDRGQPGASGDQLHALLRKLYIEKNTDATLHRDRIFSLLALAVDTSDLAIHPDYTHPTSPQTDALILTRAARALITNPTTGRIDILCHAQPLPQSQTTNPPTTTIAAITTHLPTWVPSWRSGCHPSFYPDHEIAAGADLFAACGAYTTVRPLPPPGGGEVARAGWGVV